MTLSDKDMAWFRLSAIGTRLFLIGQIGDGAATRFQCPEPLCCNPQLLHKILNMAQTLAQITKQIEKLQKEADALRQAELKGVVDRIKVAIVHYGLTPEQLGFGKPGGKKTSNSLPAAKGGNKVVIAKFSNDAGEIWSGRGPRPRWLREALANGRSLDEFSTTARKRSTEATSNVEQEMGIAAAETPISKRQAKANSKNSARANKAPAAKHTAAASKNLPRSKAKRLNQVSAAVAKVASAPNAEKSGIAILSPAAA